MLAYRIVFRFPAIDLDGTEEALDVVGALLRWVVEEACTGELDSMLAWTTASQSEDVDDIYSFSCRKLVRPFECVPSALLLAAILR